MNGEVLGAGSGLLVLALGCGSGAKLTLVHRLVDKQPRTIAGYPMLNGLPL